MIIIIHDEIILVLVPVIVPVGLHTVNPRVPLLEQLLLLGGVEGASYFRSAATTTTTTTTTPKRLGRRG